MYVTFDIGGTNTRIATSEDGETIKDHIIFPSIGHSFADGTTEFIEKARSLLNGQKVEAIAGGIPGTLDAAKRSIVTAPNLPDWSGQALADTLEHALDAPVFLENDTAIVGLGEAVKGAGRDNSIIAYITISTGFGGCRIVNQQIDVSAMGFEPGHQIVDIHGSLCSCGEVGHMESILSGGAFANKYGKLAKDIKEASVWQKAAEFLAVGLHNVLVFWSPHIIVLGGAMMKSIDIELVRQHVKQNTSLYKTIPPIAHAELGETAGLVGSLVYIKQRTLPLV